MCGWIIVALLVLFFTGPVGLLVMGVVGICVLVMKSTK